MDKTVLSFFQRTQISIPYLPKLCWTIFREIFKQLIPLKLKTGGTAFQKGVWAALRTIFLVRPTARPSSGARAGFRRSRRTSRCLVPRREAAHDGSAARESPGDPRAAREKCSSAGSQCSGTLTTRSTKLRSGARLAGRLDRPLGLGLLDALLVEPARTSWPSPQKVWPRSPGVSTGRERAVAALRERSVLAGGQLPVAAVGLRTISHTRCTVRSRTR